MLIVFDLTAAMPSQAIAASGSLLWFRNRIKRFTFLNRCRQEELFARVWQTTQAQPAQANLIAQLREECFDFISSAASGCELWRLAELSNVLAHVLIPIDFLRSASRRSARCLVWTVLALRTFAPNTYPCVPLLSPT